MNVSASGLSRFRKCVASAVLPQVKTTSEAAEVGTAIHKFMERCVLERSKEKALEGVSPELWARCNSIDVGAILEDFQHPGLQRPAVELEVAYALDPVARKARKLGVRLGRDYSGITDGEIAGSEDVVGHLKNGKMCVMDYKSGEYIPDIQNNSQLLFFAACLYLMEGLSEVEGRIVYIGENGEHTVDSHTWTAFDLEDYLDSLAAACVKHRVVLEEYNAGRQVSVTQGEWCRYCPSMASCPAYISLARHMVPELEQIDQLLLALSPEQAGIAWDKFRQLKDVYERIETGLKEYARNIGITLPNGRVVTESSFSRKYFSTDKAVRLLSTMGATQEDINSCYSSKSISAVRERLSKK